MLNINRLQDAFITGFYDIIRQSAMLKKRDWLIILPSLMPDNTVFVGLYDCQTGLGSGLNLNQFMCMSFTRHEAYVTLDKILDSIYQSISSGEKSEPVVPELFRFEMDGAVAKHKCNMATTAGARIYVYTLERTHLSLG